MTTGTLLVPRTLSAQTFEPTGIDIGCGLVYEAACVQGEMAVLTALAAAYEQRAKAAEDAAASASLRNQQVCSPAAAAVHWTRIACGCSLLAQQL